MATGRGKYGYFPSDIITLPIATNLPDDSPDHGTVNVFAESSSTTYKVYTEYACTNRITDLQNEAGTGITVVTPDGIGRPKFQGVDGYRGTYFLRESTDTDGSHPVWPLLPMDLPDLVAGSGVSSIKLGSGGTPMVGPVEIDLSNLVTLGVATDSDLDTLASTVSGHTTTLGTHTTALAADAAAIDALPTLLEVQAAIAAAVDGIGGNTLLYLDWDPGTSTYPNRSTSGTSDPTRRVAYMDGPGPVMSGTGSTGAVAGDLHVGVA